MGIKPEKKHSNRNDSIGERELWIRKQFALKGYSTSKVLHSGMVKGWSKTRKRNCDISRSTPIDSGGPRPWSQCSHDVLYLVMMQLGVVDYISFSGVCKSWRSFALSNKKKFMASKPPMLIWISGYAHEKNYCYQTDVDYCYLADVEERVFRTNLPHFDGRMCVGSTCGYLIMFGKETNDFWLVNPITRHQIHFPNVYFFVDAKCKIGVRAILVFSPTIYGWVLAILNRHMNEIWISKQGNGAWDHVSCTSRILDLHFFKGKIYAINVVFDLYELRLYPVPSLMLLETKNFKNQYTCYNRQFVRSGDNLFVMDEVIDTGLELDFGKMEWVVCKDAREKYVFFTSKWGLVAALPALWAGFRSQHTVYGVTAKIGKFWIVKADMWYFPNECLNYDIIDE